MVNSRVERNRRKILFQYGFDVIDYAEAKVAGLADKEMADYLGVSSKTLDTFEAKVKMRK